MPEREFNLGTDPVKEGVTPREADATGAGGEPARRRRIAVWVAREIMPHEARIRRWLARSRLSPEDIDEVMQEAYCRIAMLPSVDHIDQPVAYMSAIARNLMLRRLKRQQVVVFEAVSEIETWRDDRTPSPEEQAASRMSYERVMVIIAALPERCRRVVELRKIEGWSQKEIATHLGMTEKAVEKQVWTGVRAIRDAWLSVEALGEDRMRASELRASAQEGGRW
ncbi:RNA polymerase sigma factor [Novosphingobium sp. Leaf2]|uniref:RNA polymerase sigma factor n=1 Tax=Novosphingobium sp. Leaf2 TaxID=1735670 RepID=UPI000AB369C6|nr:sigma-70 family RNA polymerase sigma factor [Novosphingobium sp. Leaf2]